MEIVDEINVLEDIKKYMPAKFEELTEKEIEILGKDYSFKAKDALIKKITGYDNENNIPVYFFKNYVNGSKIDGSKLQFGNLEHIAMINGDKPFSKELYK